MTDGIFKDYPQKILDLINFAQLTKPLEIPTEEGGLIVSMSLLWEGELMAIRRRSADYVDNPSDIMSRSDYIKLETLVNAIDKIGDYSFVDQDLDTHKLKKDSLRTLLKKMSSGLVQYMYECYNELVIHRDILIAEKTKDSKKKFMKELELPVPKI